MNRSRQNEDREKEASVMRWLLSWQERLSRVSMVERKEAKLLPEVPMPFTAGAIVTAAVIINEHSLGACLFYTLILVMTHHPSSQPAETVTVIIPNLWTGVLRSPSHDLNLVACSRSCSSTNTSDTSQTLQVRPGAGHKHTTASI